MNEGPCPICVKKHNQSLHDGLCYYHRKQLKGGVKALEPVAKKSIKQAQLDRAYSVAVAVFKIENPLCVAKFEGCTIYTDDAHHPEGRIGDRLLNLKKCKPVCRNCHIICETQPDRAKKSGLSASRLAISPSEEQTEVQ
jgi:hypothetical protein